MHPSPLQRAAALACPVSPPLPPGAWAWPPRTPPRAWPAARLQAVDVPQPSPDIVPTPGTPHPVQTPDTPPEISPEHPPEVIEPALPGEHTPVSDPIVPGDTLGPRTLQ